ncbi:MAG TPA: amino acid adenylation domain-containing protein [Thermoanaerobaculia bacterium]|nr:amino acid adenylation domain-containing protein [Thermoanaerobaculia bacterium]
MDPRRVEDFYPLSPLQQGMLFHTLEAPGSGVYCEQLSCLLEGPLDETAFQATWDRVAERHAVLRTGFVWEGVKEPVQVVYRGLGVPLDCRDWRSCPGDEQRRRLAPFLDEDRRRGFDLAKAPLLRLTLLRLGEEERFFVLTHHHILLDGWSMPLVLGEAFALYGAFSRGEELELPRPRPYRDYIAWLRRRDLAAAREYWQRRLAGFAEPLDLDPVLGREAGGEQGGGRIETRLEAAATAALQGFARRHRLTLYTLVEGVFSLLLGAYTGRRDVVFGTTVSGRPADLPGVEEMVGPFINTVPARVAMRGDDELVSWLQVSMAQQAELRQYEQTPLAQIQGWSEMGRGRPLFECLLVFENHPSTVATDGSTALRLQDVQARGATNYPLTLVAVTGPEMVLRLLWDERRFAAPAIQRLLGHLATLLAAMPGHAGRLLRDLPLLPEAERHRLLIELAAAARSEGPQPCLHELFAAQARRTPDAVALVVSPGLSLSYRALAVRAHRLAHHLIRLGVGSESVVALYLDRSPEMVVSILAVLAAGGAYLPLDGSNPPDRLVFMLEDSRVSLLVTERRLLDANRLPFLPRRVVCLDGEAERIARRSREAPRVPVDPQNLAYVIYTSGSTGRPKGTAVSHANVTRLLSQTRSWFGFGRDDVWTLFHSYAFDFSVWELWGALAHGGRLVLVSYWESRSPADFHRLLATEGVTVLNQTPSAFRQLLQAEGGDNPGRLAVRTVVFGGEALDPSWLTPWLGAAVELVNMYGITETTVHVSYRPLRPADAAGSRSPIGVAIPDLAMLLLDPFLRPVPLGVPGEIYVGGAGLARGYLHLPALTAERFVPDPFAGVRPGAAPGARLYRTGDLARVGPDGDLEFLGRADDQVKVRGFRIELGEIERALAAHSAVREAVVLAQDGASGERRLVAWVVADGEPPTAGELRELLQRSLPEYMLPAAFVPLAELPLTGNGKLDRRALPPPGAVQEPAAGYVAPRDETEEVLAAIWSQALGLERVGIHDGFFALGGDSILSVRVLSMARERGIELTLQQLFQLQTIAALAREGRSAVSSAGEVVRTRPFELVGDDDRGRLPAGLEDAYPLAMLQAGMLYHMELGQASRPYHNVNSFHLQIPFVPELLAVAVQQEVARHPALRTAFDLTGYSEPLQLVYREALLPLRCEDLRHLDTAEQDWEIEAYVESEKAHPFDLSHPPQLRLCVHRRGEDTLQLTITENHAILDGWSLHSILSRVFDDYLARLAGREPAGDAAPACSYRDFVAMERAVLRSEAAQRYWQETLQGCSLAELPRRASPLLAAEGRGVRSCAETLSAELTAGLEALARSLTVPLKTLLLAAHLEVLGLQSGRQDVVSGLVTHGRPEELGGEQIRGLFLNVVPLRVRLSPGSWTDLIQETFRAEQEMLPYRRYPLAAIQAQLGNRPLFEVLFNFVYFHVADNIVTSEAARVLDLRKREGTSFPLQVGFMKLVNTPQLLVELEYDAGILSPVQMESMAGCYLQALAAMVRAPLQARDACSLLSAAERHQLVAEWNDTAAPYALEGCLHQHVAAQVVRTPESVAVSCAGELLTYGELGRRARQLARRLRDLGAGPDRTVAIAAERSLEMMVGLLAILEAGGAYVPLDLSYPPERLAFMLEDSGASLLLLGRNRAGVPAVPGVREVRIDEGGGPGLPPGGVTADHLAYVIYTSGSTGRPKGAMNTHRAICNRLLWMQEAYGLTPDDRVLQKTPTSFDVSVWELFWPLMTGARLVLARPGGHQDPAYLAELIRDEGITTVHFVPSLLRAFLDEAETEVCGASLRRVVASGEALPLALQQRFSARFRAPLYNLYGPTEAAVDVSAWTCRDEGPVAVPIGRPIANLRLLVLDASFRPVPVGVAGELYIGGEGLGRGYLGRATLTAERFVPDPQAAAPGSRLYRTGDLARHRPDGALEFLGRLDHQVKVRGVRIELEEVEAALRRHPAVREAVVAAVAGREEAGEPLLVAYVVPAAEAPEAAALRALAETRLPSSMVPSRFVFLESLPLTPSGKVDRRALPDPGDGTARSDLVAPRDALELELARLWEEVLGLRPVGVRDDFFTLGGHSLAAVRVLARIRRRFGSRLTLESLLELRTVERLADALRASPAARRSPLVELQAGGGETALFCVHPIGGNVLCYTDLARHLGPDQPFYALQDLAFDLADGEVPFTSVEGLAASYVAAIREIWPRGPYPLAGYSFGAVIAFEMARQLRSQGCEVPLLVLLDSQPTTGIRDVLELEDRMGIDEGIRLILDLEQRAGRAGASLGVPLEEIWELNPEERFSFVFEQARRQSLVPAEIALPEAQKYAQLLSRRREALKRYTPEPYPGRTVLLRTAAPDAEAIDSQGLETVLDPELFAELQRRLLHLARQPAYGWDELAASIEVHTVPGNHHTVILEPNVKAVAEQIRLCLADARRRPTCQAF